MLNPILSSLRLLSLTAAVAMVATTASLHADDATVADGKPPRVGESAPDFSLPITGSGDSLRLSEAIAHGPAVVVVLRGFPGYQCPLCSRQVAGLVAQSKTFAALSTKVILVYPGEATLLEQHAEEFQNPALLPEQFVLVRDPGFEMVNGYGLRWDAPRETAYPATFVIDTDQTVAWQLVSQGHAGRAETSDVIAALKSL